MDLKELGQVPCVGVLLLAPDDFAGPANDPRTREYFIIFWMRLYRAVQKAKMLRDQDDDVGAGAAVGAAAGGSHAGGKEKKRKRLGSECTC